LDALIVLPLHVHLVVGELRLFSKSL